MKEHPILFSAPMIRAILDGSKTQTRRIVKGLPDGVTMHRYYGAYTDGSLGGPPRKSLANSLGWFVPEAGDLWPCNDEDRIQCPYGAVGDQLWVRETWQTWTEFNNKRADAISTEARLRLNYPADGNAWDARIRPSIHMPRWASRITLEIVSVRVERLQNISEADAIAEGIDGPMCAAAVGKAPSRRTLLPVAVHGYAHLWESINGAGSWEANPWVWAIEFKRVTT